MIRTELDVKFFWFRMLETSYAASEIQVHVLHLLNLGTSGTGFEKKRFRKSSPFQTAL